LRAAGSYLDWVSIHGYWGNTANGLIPDDYMTCVLHTGEDISGSINRVRAYLTALGLEKRIKIAYDEWNLRGWYHPNFIDTWNRAAYKSGDEAFYREKVIGERNKNDINSIYTVADAVFSASFLNTCLRNCDIVKMACFSPAVNTRGCIFTYDGGIVLRPQYFVFRLYADLLRDSVLDVWKDDVPVISGKIGGSEKTVDAVDIAVTYGDGGYAIAAVNKDPDSENTVRLSIPGGGAKEMRIHTLNGPSPDAYNDIGRTEVGVTVSAWQPFDGCLTLPAHSVNVIELR
ncbi:MAG: alpha-N-arabinofuranosidase, partial [Clostridia bacterium]|nr:alpha-N-arabinofuranosidase [Clostridia bacterium]